MDEKEALLSQLKSVHVPEVSMVPAIGWWVLCACLIALVALVLWLRKRHAERLWLRQARQELKRIREQSETQAVSATLADTSRLARQLLLLIKPRKEVASLHGNAWLEALDEICERPVFAKGFGQLLESGQYQRAPQVNPSDMDSLHDAVDELINSASKKFKQPSKSIKGFRRGA